MEAISNISSRPSGASASFGSAATSLSQQPLAASNPPSQSIVVDASQKPISDSAMKDAVKQANQMLQQSGAAGSISFGYEEKLGQMYVQIHDNVTGAVVREFPSKDVRAAQIAMREMIGLILDKQG